MTAPRFDEEFNPENIPEFNPEGIPQFSGFPDGKGQKPEGMPGNFAGGFQQKDLITEFEIVEGGNYFSSVSPTVTE